MHPSWTREKGSRSRIAIGTLTLAALVSCSPGTQGDPPGNITPGTSAEALAVCAPANAEPTRYLRQLSLDLRGTPPTAEELARVDAAGSVPDEMIDGMLASPEFLAQVRDWHRALLWPNLNGFRISATDLVAWDGDPATGRRVASRGTYSPDPELIDNAAAHPGGAVSWAGGGGGDRAIRGGNTLIGCDVSLRYPAPSPTGAQPTYQVTGSDGVSRTYSYYDNDGVPLPYHDARHCPNYCTARTAAERAVPGYRPVVTDYSAMNAPRTGTSPPVEELDPAGMDCPAMFPNRVVNPCDNRLYDLADRNFRERREGYRMMRHYWSGTAEVRTCAYEAQDRTNSVATGASCAGITMRDISCGCGPNGVFCMPSVAVASNTAAASRTQSRIRDALNDEPLHIIASVVERDEDYYNVFTTRRSFINGPLAYLYRNQLGAVTGIEIGRPATMDAIPEVPFTDSTFREYVRDPEHAGVLTTSAYLGRFPTWRSRVSQFRSAFMCRPFSPASGSLPAPDDACTREPSLARRCGCQNCHAALEPMTAWFGRWAERSTRFLGPTDFPAFDPNCQQCALTGQGCTARCRTQYVVDTVDADGARYAGTLRGYLYRTPEETQRIDEGPAGLVAQAVSSGELQSCTVRTTWGKLMGRTMSENEMRTLLPDLVSGFNSGRHNYRTLVRAIVTSPAYRRVD